MANKLPAIAALTAQDVVVAGEPTWLQQWRQDALQSFVASDMPYWRRTDLSAFAFADMQLAGDIGSQQVVGETPAGVVVMPLAQAVTAHPELVQKHLGTAVASNTSKFAALNAATWRNGWFVYVPKNHEASVPLHLLQGFGESNSVVSRNLVVLERSAQLALVEQYAGDTGWYSLSVTELILGDGATLKYVGMQTWGNDVRHIGYQVAKVGNDAFIDWAAINMGGTHQHIEAETNLAGNGSRVDWVAATVASDGQRLLTAPWLRHVGRATEAHMDFKTVVKGSGYATFDGMIKIEGGSAETVTRLEEHALHLSPQARSDSIPGLKIDTNDVAKAGHASTSGEVDEEHLFYMQARGIPKSEAVHMIVMGFFEPVLDRIPLEGLREQVTATIAARI
ncbi:MAG: SufD family Fe-S cluster assembly protein [Chloroflexi bacterium]|nr:SufD family Fe-S cluster assembly protein [Chloroflexota bacterium]